MGNTDITLATSAEPTDSTQTVHSDYRAFKHLSISEPGEGIQGFIA